MPPCHRVHPIQNKTQGPTTPPLCSSLFLTREREKHFFSAKKNKQKKLLRLAHALQFGKDGYITLQAVASTHALVFRTEQLPLFFTWYDLLCLCDHLPTTHIHIHNWWALYLFIFDRLSFICAIYNLCTVMRTVAVIGLLIYIFLHTLFLLNISVHLGLRNFLKIQNAHNMCVLTLMRLKPTKMLNTVKMVYRTNDYCEVVLFNEWCCETYRTTSAVGFLNESF